MDARNEEALPAVEAQIPDSERMAWVRPEVRRMNAGSAEQGGAAVTDLGVNFS